MSSAELKDKILKKLESVDDYLLQEILLLIEFETNDFKLTDIQKIAIDESRQQIKDGNSFTDDEVNKEIDAWLNE